MKRKLTLIVVAAVLILGAAQNAAADIRLDFDIPWLLALGLNTADITGDTSGSIDLSSYHIPLPYVEFAYQFGDGALRGGVGIRTYTILVEFAGWPMGYVELEPIDRLVLRAELGGFAFFLLGIENHFYLDDYTLRVLLPDFQVSFALAPWFRIGAGVLLIVPAGDFNNFGYVTYINARFALTWK